MKTIKIKTTPAMQEFNRMVEQFDQVTECTQDRCPVEQILDWQLFPITRNRFVRVARLVGYKLQSPEQCNFD